MFVCRQATFVLSSSSFFQAKRGCQSTCGNISIPYPFGVISSSNSSGSECSIDRALGSYGFSIICDTNYEPPMLLLESEIFSNEQLDAFFIVKEISSLIILSIGESEIRLRNWNTDMCYDKYGALLNSSGQFAYADFTRSPFTFSGTKNRVFAVGCDTSVYVTMTGKGKNYTSQCQSVCGDRENVLDQADSCAGSGCCQIEFPKGLKKLEGTWIRPNNHTEVRPFNRCSSTLFMAEQDHYKFNPATDPLSPYVEEENKDIPIPVVLNWALGNRTCEEAKKDLDTFACRPEYNGYCINSDDGFGYRCSCNKGYEGNPYCIPGCQGNFYMCMIVSRAVYAGLVNPASLVQKLLKTPFERLIELIRIGKRDCCIITCPDKPGCPAKCGNVNIPYPFGMYDAAGGEECFINGVGYGYGVTCNTSYSPPKPFLGKGNVEVLSISDSEIRIRSNQVAPACFTESGVMIDREGLNPNGRPKNEISYNLNRTSFTFSYTKNKLFAIGCDTATSFLGVTVDRNNSANYYSSLCNSKCDTREAIIEGKCTGSGCCELKIPKGTNKFRANAYSYENHTKIWSFDRCGYTIMAEQDQYTFRASDLLLPSTDFIAKGKDMPIVLDWAVGNRTCDEALTDMGTFACQNNSKCINSDNNHGYRCTCNDGYEGNPYLKPGCQGT
ncbi:hypothetical protein MKW92_023401 [Papaver armeniacum]|nr:hypothetical protein MKW92_023401 [Papaver armeniacum]